MSIEKLIAAIERGSYISFSGDPLVASPEWIALKAAIEAGQRNGGAWQVASGISQKAGWATVLPSREFKAGASAVVAGFTPGAGGVAHVATGSVGAGASPAGVTRPGSGGPLKE